MENAWFRQLSTTQGRWLTPDPYSGSMDLSNPQSLNRYAHASNNPINFFDPLGLDVCPPGTEGVGSTGTCVSVNGGGGRECNGDCLGGNGTGLGEGTNIGPGFPPMPNYRIAPILPTPPPKPKPSNPAKTASPECQKAKAELKSVTHETMMEAFYEVIENTTEGTATLGAGFAYGCAKGALTGAAVGAALGTVVEPGGGTATGAALGGADMCIDHGMESAGEAFIVFAVVKSGYWFTHEHQRNAKDHAAEAKVEAACR